MHRVGARGQCVINTALSALPGAKEKAPTDAATLAIWAGFEDVPQPVLLAMVFPWVSKTVRMGCARVPATPNPASDGPSARMRSVSLPLPLITKPGIRMLAPVPTTARVEMLMRRALPPSATTRRRRSSTRHRQRARAAGAGARGVGKLGAEFVAVHRGGRADNGQ